jgi:hypothetical protein
MTENLDPTPRSGNQHSPSSAMLDIARLKERHSALKADVGDMREIISDIKELLVSHIGNSNDRHAQLLATFNQHNLEDAVVHQRVLQIDTHLAATDQRLEESTKRDPVSFWTSIAAAGTAVGAILTAIFGGKP